MKDIRTIKKNYLRKVMEISLQNDNYSTVVFYASYCLDDIKDIVEEIKDEFSIDNVIFVDFDLPKINSFYKTNPSEKEIDRFVPVLPKPVGKMKFIKFLNTKTEVSRDFCNDYIDQHCNYLELRNPELFEQIQDLKKTDMTLTVCPNKEWAKGLYGNEMTYGFK